LSMMPKSGKRNGSARLSSQISKIDARIRNCTLCCLSKERTKAVPGAGKIEDLELMLVGEAPGRKEDEAGQPFIGSAGKILDSMLKEAGLSRSEVYITNIVKCRPPGNRKPKDDEARTCTSNYLEKQIALLKPKLVCTLGATALEYFTGDSKMSESHGKLQFSENGLAIYPTYHPAAVFRSNTARAALRIDIKRLPSILGKIKQ
jgi:uracil-DNA glycosylase